MGDKQIGRTRPQVHWWKLKNAFSVAISHMVKDVRTMQHLGSLPLFHLSSHPLLKHCVCVCVCMLTPIYCTSCLHVHVFSLYILSVSESLYGCVLSFPAPLPFLSSLASLMQMLLKPGVSSCMLKSDVSKPVHFRPCSCVLFCLFFLSD